MDRFIQTTQQGSPLLDKVFIIIIIIGIFVYLLSFISKKMGWEDRSVFLKNAIKAAKLAFFYMLVLFLFISFYIYTKNLSNKLMMIYL